MRESRTKQTAFLHEAAFKIRPIHSAGNEAGNGPIRPKRTSPKRFIEIRVSPAAGGGPTDVLHPSGDIDRDAREETGKP